MGAQNGPAAAAVTPPADAVTVTGWTSGDDSFAGGAAAERFFGKGGQDRLDGGGGDDWLRGSEGDDVLAGGAGADVVDGQSGADRLVYRLADNAGAADRYDGGTGDDLLRLEMRPEDFSALRDELAGLAADIAATADPTRPTDLVGLAPDPTDPGVPIFQTSFGLGLRNVERLEVFVEGFGVVDPANTPPGLDEVTLAGVEDEPVRIPAGGVALNAVDADGDALVAVLDGTSVTDAAGDTVGSFTQLADGSFEFVPPQDFAGDLFVDVLIDDGNGEGPGGIGIDAQPAELRLALEAVADTPLFQAPDVIRGEAGEPILADVDARPQDQDGSETLRAEVTAPDAIVFTDGIKQDGVWHLDADAVDSTFVIAQSAGRYDLDVRLIATEASNGDEATLTATITVSASPASGSGGGGGGQPNDGGGQMQDGGSSGDGGGSSGGGLTGPNVLGLGDGTTFDPGLI